MRQLLKLWGLAVAVLVLAASCRKGQDAAMSEPDTAPTPAGKSALVTARLSMETNIPEDELRMTGYTDFKLTASNGYAVDIDQIEANNGGKIPVFCIIRSDDPAQPITYTKIPFTREAGNTIRIGGQAITLAAGTDFSNTNGRKWYIMGWLGSEYAGGPYPLEADMGRLFNGLEGNNSGRGHTPIYKLGITPLMFPWKELELLDEGGITLGNARKVKMTLRGAFIQVTMTNRTEATFRLSDSKFLSNAYTDFGSYNVDVTPSEGVFPEWVPYGAPNSEGFYHLNLFTGLYALAPGAQYKDFIWVMPSAPSTNPMAKIMIASDNGVSFFTDKPIRTKRIKEGKVYSLNIDVHRPLMGLDYMAEYDLLNGTETTQGTFATTHFNRQPGSLYDLSWPIKHNANILCPTGWHTPERWEWTEAVPYYSGTGTFSETKRLGSSDYTLSSQCKRTTEASYYLRYTGDPLGGTNTNNIFREAQRIRMIDNPDGGTLGAGEKMLEITSRYLGPSFTGTVDDLVSQSEAWWSDPIMSVRRVLSANRNSANIDSPSSGYYYYQESSYTGFPWYLWEGTSLGLSWAYYPVHPYIRPFKNR